MGPLFFRIIGLLLDQHFLNNDTLSSTTDHFNHHSPYLAGKYTTQTAFVAGESHSGISKHYTTDLWCTAVGLSILAYLIYKVIDSHHKVLETVARREDYVSYFTYKLFWKIW